MSTKNIPFEKFIKEFLENSNYALELEKISKRSKNTGKFVNEFFETTQIEIITEEFFKTETIEDPEKFKSILNRLGLLLKKVKESEVNTDRDKHMDILVIKECIQRVIHDKKKVTMYFVNYMNEMKSHYYE